jgi:hypothetical protein
MAFPRGASKIGSLKQRCSFNTYIVYSALPAREVDFAFSRASFFAARPGRASAPGNPDLRATSLAWTRFNQALDTPAARTILNGLC